MLTILNIASYAFCYRQGSSYIISIRVDVKESHSKWNISFITSLFHFALTLPMQNIKKQGRKKILIKPLHLKGLCMVSKVTVVYLIVKPYKIQLYAFRVQELAFSSLSKLAGILLSADIRRNINFIITVCI